MASQWNSAGTWEERDVTKWADEKLNAQLADLKVDTDSLKLNCTKVVKCFGEARKLIVRGKPRAGFEYKFELKFKGTADGADVSGTVHVEEVSETDIDDVELRVALKKGTAGVSALEDAFRTAMAQHLTQFYTALKEL